MLQHTACACHVLQWLCVDSVAMQLAKQTQCQLLRGMHDAVLTLLTDSQHIYRKASDTGEQAVETYSLGS